MITISFKPGHQETDEQIVKRINSIRKRWWLFSPYSKKMAYIIWNGEKMALIKEFVDNPESRKNFEIIYFAGTEIIKDIIRK